MGVIYLMYLGFSLLFKSKAKAKSKEESVTLNNQTLKKVFSNGVLINSLNPKVAIFFITFLPQFIDVNASQQELGLLTLGLVFIVFATFVNIIILYASLQISGKFKYTQLFTSVIKKVVGSLFILFGIKLATQDLI
jgi:threonine/homoserine/homoserine lactone efflux protein